MFSEYVYQSWKKTKYGFGHTPIDHYVDNKTMHAGWYTPYDQKSFSMDKYIAQLTNPCITEIFCGTNKIN